MYLRKGIKSGNTVLNDNVIIKLTRNQTRLFNFCVTPKTMEEIVEYGILINTTKRCLMTKEVLMQTIMQLKSLGLLVEGDNIINILNKNNVCAIKNDKLAGIEKDIYYSFKIGKKLPDIIDKFGRNQVEIAIVNMLKNKNLSIL